MKEIQKTILNYIHRNWPLTVKQPNEKVPYPFTSPCVKGLYEDFFYWDIYFINKGLLMDDLYDQAHFNLKNIAYYINKLGFMPNSTSITNRSQPPVFPLAVLDLYEHRKDIEIIKEFLPLILKEQEFFETKRMTPIGLNAYGCSSTLEEMKIEYKGLSERVHQTSDDEEEQLEIAKDICAIAESGLDFNMRFKTDKSLIAAHEFAHADLNSFLYADEIAISKMYKVLGNKQEEQKFLDKAEHRRKEMEKYFFDKEQGLYVDYNFEKKWHTHIITAATLYPHCFGVTTDKDSALNALKRLELECGVAAGEYREDTIYYQWDWPVMWGETTWIIYRALENVGAYEDAERIRLKFMASVEKCFETTGELWEKYDARDGTIINREYKAPPFMGWTAFAYQYFSKKDE